MKIELFKTIDFDLFWEKCSRACLTVRYEIENRLRAVYYSVDYFRGGGVEKDFWCCLPSSALHFPPISFIISAITHSHDIANTHYQSNLLLSILNLPLSLSTLLSVSHFFCFLFFPVFLLFVWARGTCVCLFDWMWLYSSYFILFCIFICNCNFGYIVSKIELESSTSIISQRELSKCSDMSWWNLTWSRGLAVSGQVPPALVGTPTYASTFKREKSGDSMNTDPPRPPSALWAKVTKTKIRCEGFVN